MSSVVNTVAYLETFTFRNGFGALVTTAVNADFTKTVICNGATSAVACTVAQVSTSGRYTPSLQPDTVGDWTVIVEWTADPTFAWSYSFRVVTAAKDDPVAALSGVSVTVTSPVASNGDVTVYQGDDQVAAASRALKWTSSNSEQWPDLTGAAIVLQGDFTTNAAHTVSAAGSVVTPTGANKQVQVELDRVTTMALREGTYAIQVIATLTGGQVETLVDAEMEVVRRKGA